MLEKLTSDSVWDTLKNSRLPIVMYGMGNGAEKIMDVLEARNIPIAGFFASDGFVRGHSFHGYPVQTYSDICKQYADFIVVLCFAVHDAPTIARIAQISREHLVVAPDVPVAGGGLFTREFVAAHDAEFDAAYALLADAKSRQTYLDVLEFKLSGDIRYLLRCQTEKQALYQTVLPLSKTDCIVDLGAYDGDTALEFLSASDGAVKKIIAWEPDEKNFKKLLRNTHHLSNIECMQLAAWDQRETLFFARKAGRQSALAEEGVPVQADSVDNLIQEPVTLLKMDIEGSESRALEGAKHLIRTQKPRLYICAYHRNSDMFRLPLQVHGYCPDYRFYFRHHPYLPAWESNFYGIIK